MRVARGKGMQRLHVDGAYGKGLLTPDGMEVFKASHWQELPDAP
jgi:hypothetical protein